MPVPAGVVTEIVVCTTPAGTGTVIWVAEFTTKPGAAVLPKATAVAPVKSVPVSTTLVPAAPLVGVKLLITGAGTTKLAALAPVPKGVVTRIRPVRAVVGTLTVMLVPAPFTTKPGAFTLLKLTAVAPVKSVPVMMMLVPAAPLVGVKLLTTGAGGRFRRTYTPPLPAGLAPARSRSPSPSRSARAK